MIVIDTNGGYIFNAKYPNTDPTGQAIQIIDDNSELGQKIISMIPNVTLIYTDGLVTDCEEYEPTPEPTELEILQSQVEYLAMMMEVDLDE